MIIKAHWVCFTCRKQFRKPLHFWSSASWSIPHQNLNWIHRELQTQCSCPQCGKAMINMGKYFKAPRREAVQEWEKLQRLAEHGIRFSSEGNVAFLRLLGGKRPNKKATGQMIACCLCHTATEGQRLLLKIVRKKTSEKSKK